jgi:hypothetical protein
MCLPLADGTTAEQGASCFVNPMTALGMTETMRMEGHGALVHTAAASNLGQMLNRICHADNVDLVNIVRRSEQEAVLREIGARYVVNSSSDSFSEDLYTALGETGRDPGLRCHRRWPPGGPDFLSAMERVAVDDMTEYSRYGSTTFTSRCTSTAPSTCRRPRCSATSGSPGASAAGCCRTSSPGPAREVMGRMQRRVAGEITAPSPATTAAH